MHSTLDSNEPADFNFTVAFNGREHSVAVRQRPFLFEFLERVAQLYEVVVFTASQKVYAEQLLNILDPKRYANLILMILHPRQADNQPVVNSTVINWPPVIVLWWHYMLFVQFLAEAVLFGRHCASSRLQNAVNVASIMHSMARVYAVAVKDSACLGFT